MLGELRNQIRGYYKQLNMIGDNTHNDSDANKRYRAVIKKTKTYLEDKIRENPDIDAAELKSGVYDIIADNFEPVLFTESPFFFEMGLKAPNDAGASSTASGACFRTVLNRHKTENNSLYQYLSKQMDHAYKDAENEGLGLFSVPGCFDIDHHTFGYTKLFQVGFNGLKKEIENQLNAFDQNSKEYKYLSVMHHGLNIMIEIALKFSKKAEQMLEGCTNEKQRENLEMIAKAAKNVPANPPATFYEGLATLLFIREVCATVEGIGMSHLGHVDKLLGKLYEHDHETGVITEEKARELISKWMLLTDVKFNVEDSAWPESSTCIQLGGCDENGEVVFNQVTKMFIEIHQELHLVNPKLNCRYSQNTPREYLELIGDALLSGDNNFALSNDEVLVGGLVQNNVDIEDARCYVNGGCQETMIEGAGHTEGANTYISIMKIFQYFLKSDRHSEDFVPAVDTSVSDFDTFFADFIKSFCRAVTIMTDYKNFVMELSKDAYLCPIFSSVQKGCINSGTDYSAGGSKYNFVSLCLTGIGTLADSLYAIKHVVFDKKIVTLEELIQILDRNWDGHEDLRQLVLQLPKYGLGHAEVDILAKKFYAEISRVISKKKNTKGGTYIISSFAYYYYQWFATTLKATPDGRRYGDLINAGISPSQLVELKDCISPLDTIKNVGYDILKGGNAVLDISLPMSKKLSREIIAAYIQACGEYNCPTLQPNAVSVEELKAAKVEPEKYKHLIVRICGLSAYFVALEPHVQDEIIGRHMYNM